MTFKEKISQQDVPQVEDQLIEFWSATCLSKEAMEN